MKTLPVTSPTLRFTAWTLLILFTTIVSGSYFTKTEIVARGTGRVLAIGRTQTIQPQFDGKISEIRVTDGQSVKSGEPLVTLDKTQIDGEIGRLAANLDQALRELAINEVILVSLEKFDPDSDAFVKSGLDAMLSKADPNQPNPNDLSLLKEMLTSYSANVLEFNAQILHAEKSIEIATTKIETTSTELNLVAQRNQSGEGLAKKGLISKSTYLDQKKESASAAGEVSLAEMQRAEAETQKLTIIRSKDRYLANLRAEKQQKVAELRNTISVITADLTVAKNKLFNTTISSPISGKIENLQVFTQGGHVSAGQTLMSVIPTSGEVEVEALFENRDAGFLAEGQTVFIKLDSYPAERFGFLKGKISSVGADSRKDSQTQNWVYAAKIKLDRGFIERQGKRFPIVAGMTVTTDVITGDRRLISYFFEPITKALQDGFGER